MNSILLQKYSLQVTYAQVIKKIYPSITYCNNQTNKAITFLKIDLYFSCYLRNIFNFFKLYSLHLIYNISKLLSTNLFCRIDINK